MIALSIKAPIRFSINGVIHHSLLIQRLSLWFLNVGCWEPHSCQSIKHSTTCLSDQDLKAFMPLKAVCRSKAKTEPTVGSIPSPVTFDTRKHLPYYVCVGCWESYSGQSYQLSTGNVLKPDFTSRVFLRLHFAASLKPILDVVQPSLNHTIYGKFWTMDMGWWALWKLMCHHFGIRQAVCAS